MYSNHREVYIFYTKTGIDLKEKQLAESDKDKNGWQERNLVLHIMDNNTARSATERWKIEATQPFTFLLIGKDGSEKFRSDSFVSNSQLFSLIDAMPMRKVEMKRKP